MHELFSRWKDRIFKNDPATRKKLLEMLEAKKNDTNIKSR